MRKLIENYLTKYGVTDISWHTGRKGYFILGKQYGDTICIDLNDVVNEILNGEKIPVNNG